MGAWTVTCPQCECVGDNEDDFRMSLAGECFCPACGLNFELDTSDDEEEDDDGPEAA